MCPMGNLDPWATVVPPQAGAPSGRMVVSAERVPAARTLTAFLTRPDAQAARRGA